MKAETNRLEARLSAIEQTLNQISVAAPCEDKATNVKWPLNCHGNQMSGTNANFNLDAKIEQIVKNVIEKDKRKCNIILFTCLIRFITINVICQI